MRGLKKKEHAYKNASNFYASDGAEMGIELNTKILDYLFSKFDLLYDSIDLFYPVPKRPYKQVSARS